MKKLLSILIVLIICSANGYAFDGQRKGIALGFGLGMSPYSYSKNKTLDLTREYDGFAMNFIGGYNIDNKNLICLESIVVFPPNFDEKERNGDVEAAASVGISWYHYYQENPSSIFSMVGIGRYGYGNSDDEYFSNGNCFILGGGYEFMKQLQIGAYYTYSPTKGLGPDGYKYTNHSLAFLVTIIAY